MLGSVVEVGLVLVVRKCAQIVNDDDYPGSTLGDRLLLEHFGVE